MKHFDMSEISPNHSAKKIIGSFGIWSDKVYLFSLELWRIITQRSGGFQIPEIVRHGGTVSAWSNGEYLRGLSDFVCKVYE